MDLENPALAAQKDDKIVVFIIRRESKCAECGDELASGAFLRLDGDKPLCMECADLDWLEFLPSGDAALTRRASKHSPLRAVVVQWSRRRKRYERRGTLVDAAAIARAEEECLADAEVRLRRQQREGVRREELDQKFIASFANALKEQFPGCPEVEAAAIAHHACLKHSGRVGRSAAAKELDPKTVRLAAIAHIRHVHTKYDRLLGESVDRHEARAIVRGDIDQILNKWERR